MDLGFNATERNATQEFCLRNRNGVADFLRNRRRRNCAGGFLRGSPQANRNVFYFFRNAGRPEANSTN